MDPPGPSAGRASWLDALVIISCLVAYGSCICLSESPYGDMSLRQRFTLNPWDDLNGGYITGPLRLLSEGRLGEDPFNGPRSLSLGGQALLQSFALLILPPTFIHMMDPGLAILALPLVFQHLGRRGGWPGWLAPSLTLLCLVLKTHWVNASAQLLPTVFLLALYGMLDSLAREPRVRPSACSWSHCSASALISLKNILVPGTCLILGLFVVLDYLARREPRRTVASGLLTCLLMGLLLAPWMVSSYRASGTALYPLLGQGYWANPLGNMPSLASHRDAGTEARQLFSILKDPRILLLVLLGVPGIAVTTRDRLRQGSGVAFLAVLLASVPVMLLFAHVCVSMPGCVTATTPPFLRSWLRLPCCWGPRKGGAGSTAWREAGQEPSVPCWWCSSWPVCCTRPTSCGVPQPWLARQSAGAHGIRKQSADHYRQLQAAIPPGQRFFCFLPMAHLLDYRRNPIDVAHLNCGISPPPGIPLRGTAEEVAHYLRSRGIWWFATRDTFWTSGGESRDPEVIWRWSKSSAGSSRWDADTIYSYYAMARSIRSLMEIYETRHFSGDLVLIELGRPKSRQVLTTGRDGRGPWLGTHLPRWHLDGGERGFTQ